MWTYSKTIFSPSLSGVSIEFLCFPRPEEPIEHVMSCLLALSTLLESPCAKTHIAEDQVRASLFLIEKLWDVHTASCFWIFLHCQFLNNFLLFNQGNDNLFIFFYLIRWLIEKNNLQIIEIIVSCSPNGFITLHFTGIGWNRITFQETPQNGMFVHPKTLHRPRAQAIFNTFVVKSNTHKCGLEQRYIFVWKSSIYQIVT